jgi:hypothetical protein
VLKFTLVWVLRFAPGRFLGGLILCALSIYMIAATPAATDKQVFVAAPFAFGTTPWVIGMIVGALLVAWAWHRGRSARFGG